MIVSIKKPQDWHQDAYNHWLKVQNYKEVATKFKKSMSQIQRISKFYEWRKKRLALMKTEDEIFAGQLNIVVGDIRKRQIKHIHAVTGWVRELTEIHETLIREKRPATEAEIAQMKRLNLAIDDFNPKDSRDRTTDLKENVHFAPPKPAEKIIPGSPEGVTVTGPTLIIVGPGQSKKLQAQLEIEDAVMSNQRQIENGKP